MRREDPRLGPLLRRVARDVESLPDLDAATGRGERVAWEPDAGAALVRLEQEIRRITRLPLEKDVADLLSRSGVDLRRRQITLRYCCLEDSREESLRGLGAALGMTGERVRQIVSATVRRGRLETAFLPSLDAALALLARSAPVAVQDFAQRLVEARIAATLLPPAAVERLARCTGRTLALHCVTKDGDRHWIALDPAREREAIVKMAQRLALRRGAITAREVADRAGRRGRALEEGRVEEVLGSNAAFEAVVHAGVRYHVPTSLDEGPLHREACRSLALAGPQRVEDLRASLLRTRRVRDLPPAPVLARGLAASRGFQVGPDAVALSVTDPVGPAQAPLPRARRTRSSVGEEVGPAVRAPANAVPTSDPRPPPAGTAVSEVAHEQLHEAAHEREPRPGEGVNWGRGGEKRVWIRVQAPADPTVGWFQLPRDVAPRPRGSFPLLAPQGGHVLCEIRCRGTRGQGLAPAWRAVRPLRGEDYALHFDLDFRQAWLEAAPGS